MYACMYGSMVRPIVGFNQSIKLSTTTTIAAAAAAANY